MQPEAGLSGILLSHSISVGTAPRRPITSS